MFADVINTDSQGVIEQSEELAQRFQTCAKRVRKQANRVLDRLEVSARGVAASVDIRPSKEIWTKISLFSDVEYEGDSSYQLKLAADAAEALSDKLRFYGFDVHILSRDVYFPNIGRCVHQFEVWSNIANDDQVRIFMAKPDPTLEQKVARCIRRNVDPRERYPFLTLDWLTRLGFRPCT